MRRAVAITCKGVSKSFALIDRGNAWRIAFGLDQAVSRYKALQDVTFDVPKGQFVGVLGRNGAGKSTLLRVIGGAYSADVGRVSVTGAMSALYELGVVGSRELTTPVRRPPAYGARFWGANVRDDRRDPGFELEDRSTIW